MTDIYELLEQAGHVPVHLFGPQAGMTTYCCDRCSSLFFLASDRILGFFPGPAGPSIASCTSASPRGLKNVLKQIDKYLSPRDDTMTDMTPRFVECHVCEKPLAYAGEAHSDAECQGWRAVKHVMAT